MSNKASFPVGLFFYLRQSMVTQVGLFSPETKPCKKAVWPVKMMVASGLFPSCSPASREA